MAQENKQVLRDAFNFFSSLFFFPWKLADKRSSSYDLCVWLPGEKPKLIYSKCIDRTGSTQLLFQNRHSFGKLQHLTQKPDLVATNFKAADQITEGEHADNFVFFLQTTKWQEVVYSLRYLHFICISMHRSSAQPYYLYKVDFLINILYINNT